jgi:hypothetical protein
MADDLTQSDAPEELEDSPEIALQRQSPAKQEFRALETPNPAPGDAAEREAWLIETTASFVASTANKSYFEVLLKTLWPEGHGLPGPYVSEDDLRAAIDDFRRAAHKSDKPYKPYVDVFRRVRELQGEEGVTGIAKQGRTYQLVELDLSPKRIPRTHLSNADWAIILARYNSKCAACGRAFGNGKFQQDHKIPRLRGGGDELENWQPLCNECNNFKSTACRGCDLDCLICPWAFPEKYAPLKITGDIINEIRKLAESRGQDPHDLADEILREYLSQPEK